MRKLLGVFFDLGGTLVDIKPALYQNIVQGIAKAHGVTIFSATQLESWVMRLKNAEKACLSHVDPADLQKIKTDEAEHIFWMEHYHEVLEQLEIPTIAQNDLVPTLTEMRANPDSFDCYPEVWETLEVLGLLGINRGIISNAFPSARKILDQLRLTAWFNPIVLSYEEDFPKPDKRIYRRALDLAGILPQEALFVDDRPTFVMGAKVAKMRPLLLDRHEEHAWRNGKIAALDEIGHLIVAKQFNMRMPCSVSG